MPLSSWCPRRSPSSPNGWAGPGADWKRSTWQLKSLIITVVENAGPDNGGTNGRGGRSRLFDRTSPNTTLDGAFLCLRTYLKPFTIGPPTRLRDAVTRPRHVYRGHVTASRLPRHVYRVTFTASRLPRHVTASRDAVNDVLSITRSRDRVTRPRYAQY